MSVFGPRLDRPSAVGDEGRPRTTSLTIAAVVVAGLAFGTFYLLDSWQLASTIAFAAGIYVTGMALLGRHRTRDLVVGHLAFHVGAGLVVVLLAAFARLPYDVLLAGFVLAMFGLAATWADVFTKAQIEEVTTTVPISYVAILLSLAVWFVLIGTGRFVASHLGRLFASTDPSTSLFGFLAWVATAGVAVRVAVWMVPFHELLPRRNRGELVGRIERVGHRAGRAGGGAVAAMFVVSVVGVDVVDEIVAVVPPVELLLAVLSSPLVVGPLVVVAVAVSLAAMLALVVNKLAVAVADGNDDLLAGAVAGFLVATLVAFLRTLFVTTPWGVRFASDVESLVGLVLVASLVMLVVNAIVMAAMDVGILPDRAAGSASCAVGLLIAAVGAGLAGLPAPVIFGCVAGAVLVWDLSTFGLGLTVELGHRPDTRRLELYHGLLSVGVGVVAVGAATGLLRLRRAAHPPGGPWSAVALAVLGAMLLAYAASRREA